MFLGVFLGGLRYIGDVNLPTNLDGILTQGLYYGNPADTIFSNREQVSVCVINIGGKVIQHVTGRDSGKTISRSYNGSSWSSWQRLDAFGCATESELASLLGVQIPGEWTICSSAPSQALSLGVFISNDYRATVYSITGAATDGNIATATMIVRKPTPSSNAEVCINQSNNLFGVYYVKATNPQKVTVYIGSKRGSGVHIGLLVVGKGGISRIDNPDKSEWVEATVLNP